MRIAPAIPAEVIEGSCHGGRVRRHFDGLDTWQPVPRDARRVADIWF